MWLHCTPHSYSSTKLARNVPPAYKPIRLAAGVRRWWQKQWPDMSQMTCSSSLVLRHASQGDSLSYLACVTQWQLSSICCKPLYMTDKGCWRGKNKKGERLGQRQTGCVYLCEPVSVGGSWGVAEQRKKHRMCTGLQWPAPGTFQTLHLQKRKRRKQVYEGHVLIV